MKNGNANRNRPRRRQYEKPAIRTGRLFDNVMACIKLTGDAGCRLRLATS
ncbi:MAG: hypothetical protein RDV41_08100 [Planctomycetota bacterium]|nr:hypothetical protein [Planctomycetota bacterium]